MRKLIAFNQVSVDGYFVDQQGAMSWAKNRTPDAEFQAFVEANASGGGPLLFGRITYELMASYWPTPHALEHDPVVAERMNQLPKVVFSRTLERVLWSNTTLAKGDLAAAVRSLKDQPGPGMAILGSGTIVSQLAQQHLIDEFQLVVIPVVLGKGRTMFDGVKDKLPLTLTSTRTFGNGNVLLCYEPAA